MGRGGEGVGVHCNNKLLIILVGVQLSCNTMASMKYKHANLKHLSANYNKDFRREYEDTHDIFQRWSKWTGSLLKIAIGNLTFSKQSSKDHKNTSKD